MTAAVLVGGLLLGGERAVAQDQAASAPAARWEAEATLASWIARFEALADEPWPPIGDGPPLHEGDEDPRVPGLRRRLEQLGVLAREDVPAALLSEAASRRYTPELVLAVRDLQRRHGLTDDGVVGEHTLAALDLTPVERAVRLREALDGLRSLPVEASRRALIVNLPEYVLRTFEDGAQVRRMRVVVGDVLADRPTPTLHAHLAQVVFHPYWNVPRSIAREELVPNGAAWLATHGYEAVDAKTGRHLALDAGTLADVLAGAARLRQRPGAKNALGQVKFLFPNPYDVYLHDTPSKGLFGREIRAFSHGCIRVEEPLWLAAWLLGPQGWSDDDVRDAARGDRERAVRLEDDVPVHVVAWPAFAEPDGIVVFAPRPYRP